MKIKKLFYRKIKVAGKEIVKLHRKVVLEKYNDFYYICKEYKWNEQEKAWISIVPHAFFDGKKMQDTGIIKTRTMGDVDNYFKLLIEIEMYSNMDLNEKAESAETDLEHLNKLNEGD